MVLAGGWLLCAWRQPSRQRWQDFVATWAVLIVAGDYRAHNGAQSEVFDNGRHDLGKAFAEIGFSPGQHAAVFRVDPDAGTRSMPDVSAASPTRCGICPADAPDGCLIYFTSHGTPDGIVIGDAMLSPDQLGDDGEQCLRRASPP